MHLNSTSLSIVIAADHYSKSTMNINCIIIKQHHNHFAKY